MLIKSKILLLFETNNFVVYNFVCFQDGNYQLRKEKFSSSIIFRNFYDNFHNFSSFEVMNK